MFAEVVAPTRVVQNHHFDSTNWDVIALREGDVVVANWAKSGTTWVQQIVCQLLHDGREDARLIHLSMWPEWLTMTREEARAQAATWMGRRLFKSHLPADALPFASCARYIYVGRDPRDVVWSLHPHHLNASDALYQSLNNSPRRIGAPFQRPDPDIRSYYRTWMAQDGQPYWPYWSHVQSWWMRRNAPNVLLLHFDDLKADPHGTARAIARFIGIAHDDETWARIHRHSSFAWMKAHIGSLIETSSFNDASNFVNCGENGRWRDILTAAEVAMADEAAEANLSADCREWLMRGTSGHAPTL